LQVQCDFHCPDNSLPRLRFGWNYQIRIRAVDLAGNSLSVPEADTVIAAIGVDDAPILPRTLDFTYRRYEAVNAPELVLRTVMTEGESLETLVIRSNVGVSAKGVNERHVAPPKTSQYMAELHGMLDRSFGSAGDFGTYYNICRKEKGTFNEGSIHGEPQLTLPYLPDPIARGAALFGLPGVSGERLAIVDHQLQPFKSTLWRSAAQWLGYLTQIDYGSNDQWPELTPFRLQLAEPPGVDPNVPPPLILPPPAWDDQNRVLTVFLFKAGTATVYLSSYPGADDLPLLLPHDWVNDPSGNAGRDDISGLAQFGALTLISPTRKVTLVHAVQQPLAPPVPAGDFAVPRAVGGTRARIGGTCLVRWKSTAKLDLWARWIEHGPDDDSSRKFNSHVYEIPIPTGDVTKDDLVAVTIGGDQEFGDTRFRLVQYQLVATTRFLEYFPEDIRNNIALVTQVTDPQLLELRAEVLSTASPPAPKVSYILPAFQWITPEAIPGDPITLNRQRVGGGLRVYLGEKWYLSGDGEKLAVVVATSAAGDTPTQLGLDPTVLTTMRQAPALVMNDVNGEPATVIDVPGTGASIVAYGVEFDHARGLWFADMQFVVGAAYFPFVRLVLARYQPFTLSTLSQLSDRVTAGITQLSPERFVTLLATPPQNPSDPDGVILIRIQVSNQQPGSTPPAADGPSGIAFEVAVEQRTVPGLDDEFAWTVDPALQPVADPGPPTAPFLWTGTVSLPSSLPFEDYRLVVKEFDPRSPTSDEPRRVVFADAITLDNITDAIS
jgi:hypothetical protein